MKDFLAITGAMTMAGMFLFCECLSLNAQFPSEYVFR